MLKAIEKKKKKISARIPEVRMKPETGRDFQSILREIFIIFQSKQVNTVRIHGRMSTLQQEPSDNKTWN